MKERIFEGRLSDEIAQGDRGYRERLKAAARQLVGIIREGLVRDGHVRIHGFGSFRLRPMKARAGINPRTGERITIPARQRVLFRPAKALRERIEPERPRARPIAEPHASREASLGTGAFTVVRPWGTVPSAEAAPAQRPWRAPERPDTGGAGDEPHASREATLGGTMQEPHPAGALPPEADGEAAVAGDAAPPPAPPGRPDWDGARDVAVASAGAGAIDDAAAGDGGQDRRGAGRWGAAALLAVVLALLLWWLWPASQPPSRVAQAPATGSEPADDGAAQGDAAPAQAGEAGPGDAGNGDGAAAAGDGRDAAPTGDAAPADTAPESDARADAAGAADDADRDAAGDGAEAQRPDAAPAEDRAADADAGGAAQGPEAIADAGDAADDAPAGAGGGAADDARAAGDTAGEATAGAQPPEAAAAGESRSGDGDTGAGGTAQSPDGAAETGRAADAPVAGTADERDPAVASPGEPPDVASAAATPETGAATAAEAAPDAPADGGPYFAARAYTVRAGDSLWHLAARHYGDAYYWPHIWNHNEELADPDVIRVDRQLRLPALEGGPQQLTAADRRSIAEGYLRLYRLYRARGHARPRDALVAARRFDASVLPEALRQAATARPGNAVAAATAAPARDGR